MIQLKREVVTIDLGDHRVTMTEGKFKHEATRAREYLRITGREMTPDRLHELLELNTSRATLARKMREACRRGELLRVPYTNDRGTEIASYRYNPDYKEKI